MGTPWYGSEVCICSINLCCKSAMEIHMDLQNGSVVWILQPGHAVWICSMDLQPLSCLHSAIGD